MDIKVGDILIFKGNIDKNIFFDNFKIGEKYEIEMISDMLYDYDDFYAKDSKHVIFKNHSWGCLYTNLEKYFTTQAEYRDEKIKKVLGDE